MVFSSPIFLFWFLPLVLLIYYLSASRFRNAFLLLCSLLFYTWGEGAMMTVMLVSIVGNYLGGIAVDRSSSQTQRKLSLAAAVIFNLGLLLWFKYANFFADNYNHLAAYLGISTVFLQKVILPLGISFFTFHGLSYVIDVYRGKTAAQRNLLHLGLYISFFPQLIAGPIIRYHDVHEQLLERNHSAEMMVSGIRRFIKGLAKKVLIANAAGHLADQVFALPGTAITLSLSWLGMLAYLVQLYFDFSGYSDMAIGLGRMFGFSFKENFNYPYISRSMKEFWTRWHISLSGWFKDYLYIPLGGSRRGKFRHLLNIFIVFFLMGFWHGAAWTFVAFGIIIALLLILESVGWGSILEKLPRFLQHAYTMIVFTLALVLIRSDSLTQARFFWKGMLGFAGISSPAYHPGLYLDAYTITALLIGILFSMPLSGVLYKKLKHGLSESVRPWAEMARTGIYLTLLLLCCIHLASSTYNPFIYFRF